jgi:hypothetical protein
MWDNFCPRGKRGRGQANEPAEERLGNPTEMIADLKHNMESMVDQLISENDAFIFSLAAVVRAAVSQDLANRLDKLSTPALEQCSELTGKTNSQHKYEGLSKIIFAKEFNDIRRRERAYTTCSKLFGNIVKLSFTEKFANPRGDVQWTGRNSVNSMIMEIIKDKAASENKAVGEPASSSHVPLHSGSLPSAALTPYIGGE